MQTLRSQAAGPDQYVAQAEGVVTDLRRQLGEAQVRMQEQTAAESTATESLKAQCRNDMLSVEHRAEVHVESLEQ